MNRKEAARQCKEELLAIHKEYKRTLLHTSARFGFAPDFDFKFEVDIYDNSNRLLERIFIKD